MSWQRKKTRGHFVPHPTKTVEARLRQQAEDMVPLKTRLRASEVEAVYRSLFQAWSEGWISGFMEEGA